MEEEYDDEELTAGAQAPFDEEALVDEVLGTNPRAAEIAGWREVLEQRLAGLQTELAQALDASAQKLWRRRISELRGQIAIAAQEEAISRFVENSVRVALHRPDGDGLN
ncbi:MAG: hypothetical protein KGJ62_06315 [Armatimonadetes bacterium]|nr:hypothetical protein [Armatimonadota bacterium]MDE2205873.1 hypothetical protein [Armatimonadota bacterium]